MKRSGQSRPHDKGWTGGPAPGLGSRIAARFRKIGLSTDLPELRGQPVRPAGFGK
jgi:hypothetical protein